MYVLFLKRICVSFCLVIVVAVMLFSPFMATAGNVEGQIYNTMKSVARTCYPGKKVVGFKPKVYLGDSGQRNVYEMYLNNKEGPVEIHFTVEFDGPSGGISRGYVVEAQCVEHRSKQQCTCPAIRELIRKK